MYKPLLICCLFLFPAVRPAAQTANGDTTRIKQLMDTGGAYIFRQGEEPQDLDSARYFLNQALRLSEALHSAKFKNETLKLIGDSYLEGHEMEKGKAAFAQVTDYYHKTGDAKKEAETWYRYGECIPVLTISVQEEKARAFDHARILFYQAHDTLDAIKSFKNVADAHLCLGRLDLAESEFLQVLAQFRAIHYPNLHYTYDLLATLYSLKGQPNRELYYNMEAIKSMEATGDTYDMENSYYKLAVNYYQAKMYDKSTAYFRKAIEIVRAAHEYGVVYSVMTATIISMTDDNKAAEALEMVKSIIRDIPPTTIPQLIEKDESLAICYQALHQYDKARRHYEDMIRRYEAVRAKGHTPTMEYVHYYSVLGEFYVQTKQYRQAAFYLDKLKALPPGIIAPLRVSKIEELLFKIDSASGNYISAIRHYEQYKKLNDSIFTTARIRELEELQIQYETDKKDKDLQLQSKNIQLLTETNRLQQSQVEKTRTIRNAVISGSGVLLLLLIVSYNRYRLKQRSNLQLQAQQIEISAKNTRLQHLLRDNEWLLREVHHRVKNNLQIVMSLLNSQSAYLQDEAALNAVLESQHRVQAMSLIHQKLYKSHNVSSISMPDYISDLVEYLKDSFNTRQNVYFDIQIEPIELDVLHAVPLSLIMNEAITNALKYAFPHGEKDRISIRFFRSSPTEISLVITDNGRGLPPGFEITRTGSFGMTLIQGLTEDLDGILHIESNNGTSLHMTFKNPPPAQGLG